MEKLNTNILMRLGNLELTTISKAVLSDDGTKTFTSLPVTEGLVVKYLVVPEDGSKGKYVPIAFVRVHKDGTCHYESYGSRIEETCTDWDTVRQFRKVLEVAADTITTAWANTKATN